MWIYIIQLTLKLNSMKLALKYLNFLLIFTDIILVNKKHNKLFTRKSFCDQKNKEIIFKILTTEKLI